eukprot:354237-Chlamydomonas_euryale.AAC.6
MSQRRGTGRRRPAHRQVSVQVASHTDATAAGAQPVEKQVGEREASKRTAAACVEATQLSAASARSPPPQRAHRLHAAPAVVAAAARLHARAGGRAGRAHGAIGCAARGPPLARGLRVGCLADSVDVAQPEICSRRSVCMLNALLQKGEEMRMQPRAGTTAPAVATALIAAAAVPAAHVRVSTDGTHGHNLQQEEATAVAATEAHAVAAAEAQAVAAAEAQAVAEVAVKGAALAGQQYSKAGQLE